MSNFIKSDWKKTYSSNLGALKGRYPDLFEAFSTTDNTLPPNVIRLKPDVIFPDVVLENQTKKILYYDSDDPIGYCRGYLESLDLHYAPVLIFLGFGLGYQVVSALHDFSKKWNTKYIIIIEKDPELFRAALMSLDYSEVIGHPEIEFFVGIEPYDLFKSFRKYFSIHPETDHFFKSLKIVILPSVQHVYADYYEKAVDSLKYSIMHELQHMGNDPYDSLLGIDQTLSNVMPMIEDPGIISFKNSLKHKPAILVGAGPSLNKNIHLLKEAYHKALLVCVDAALKPLLDNGIRPHIVTNIERTGGQGAFFSDLGKLEDTFFVFCPVVPDDTYDSYQGPKIIAHRYSEIVEWLGLRTGVLTAGPLVGNFAFDIAQYLGCDPIIMVGQDLSFPLEGATHVEGMVFGVQEDYRKSVMSVEGNFGETLLTNRDFEDSRRSLEMEIEKFDGLCINSTEGGAKINGTMFFDLKSSINRYCPDLFDFSGHLKMIWGREKDKKQNTKSEIKRIVSVLNQTVSELEIAMNACKQGLDIIATTEVKYDLIIDKKPNPLAIARIVLADNELYQIREQIISHPTLRFLAYIFTGFHSDFAMRRNFLFDQFYSLEFASLKAFIMEKEWFTIMGQLLLSTIYSITRAKSQLENK